MRQFAVFTEVPLHAIRPTGWLRLWLLNQKHGLTGHLEEAGEPFCDPEKSWVPPSGREYDKAWSPYEPYAYWLDGRYRCAALLRDEELKAEALRVMQHVLDHRDRDGYIGPKFLKRDTDTQDYFRSPRYTRWPHAVFFRALMAWGDNEEPAVAGLLRAHFLESPFDHIRYRNVCNVEAMIWAHDRTGDPALLALAEKTWAMFEENLAGEPASPLTTAFMLSDQKPVFHGVGYNEVCKQPCLIYLANGDRRRLDAAENAFRKLNVFHGIVDGIHCANEHLRGRNSVLDTHETCVIADHTWSLGYLLEATGKAEYADAIERAMFNAAPGAVTPDFKALQYFSGPNQVIADRHSNHNEFHRGATHMSYRPNPGTYCCPGDVNRMMPCFAGRLWMRDAAGNPVAAFYGPSEHEFEVHGARFRIVEDTAYPFEETIRFRIRTDGPPARFALVLRVPGWCRGPRVLCNGAAMPAPPEPGRYFRVEREFRDGDGIELNLPMHMALSRWDTGVALERGPLVYTLRIEEKWEIDREDKQSSPYLPAWNITPQSPWNYALLIDPDRSLEQQFELVRRPFRGNPWEQANAPLEIRAKARRVRGWKEVEIGPEQAVQQEIYAGNAPIAEAQEKLLVAGHFRFTPPLPDPATLAQNLEPQDQTITLLPYGCCRLRLTVFPYVEV